MINFYKRVKDEILSDKNNRGYGEKVIVDRRSLLTLLDDYERLDKEYRKRIIRPEDPLFFKNIIELEYINEGRDEMNIFMKISEILKPIINDDAQKKRIKELYR